MKIRNNTIQFSASDVSSHIGCQYLTQLKLKVARKELTWPVFNSVSLDVLRDKGQEFEREFLDQLKAEGKTVVEIDPKDSDAEAQTLQAMQQGADIIYQAKLSDGIWGGIADFLQKTSKPSPTLGPWSYEVLDTKLARETKAGSILQICLYSSILEQWQGILPEHMYIKTPEQLQPYRVNDFMAYFRLVRQRLQQAVANQTEVYPHPVAHCEVCDWWDHCNQRRRDDDHLSFIAGMGSSQIREVRNWEVETLAAMATVNLTDHPKPKRGSIETFQRLKEQARVQLEARETGKPVYELLPLEPTFGFYKLPEPSKGDVFFDFEGDPFVDPSGREYLFGWVLNDVYHHFWALDEVQEKKTFEDFVDSIMALWEKHPDMHIYHFAPYEPAALKRLMGKYATRENEIDSMLRAGIFVDLHSVVKQALRAGIESYSLKELEKFHKFSRKQELRALGKEKMTFECLLESGLPEQAPEAMLTVIRDYNEDDCRSTESLRDWLEKLRAGLVAKGHDIPRPEITNGEAGEKVTEHQIRIKPIYDALMNDLPLEGRHDNEQAHWLLANMLDWYRREDKSYWWEYYRLAALPNEEYIDERVAIGGLVYTGKRALIKKSVIDEYHFPIQETEIEPGDKLKCRGESAGTVEDIDAIKGKIWIRKGNKTADNHPDNVYNLDKIDNKVKEEAIIRLAQWVVDNDMTSPGSYKAGRDLLIRSNPNVSAPFSINPNPQLTAVNWVKVLDDGILPIQGPPGSGKSHTAADMILELVKMGKKVGITAMSHKVISALMDKVRREADKRKKKIKMVQKVREQSQAPLWEETDDNAEVLDLLETGKVQIAAGTPFMWAREEFFEAVDYMFVDEAGQLSLIDTLALSHAARNLLLLGDPQQLKQPQQGSHPEGTELSALEHILQDQKTILPAQGVFLDKTWRLHSSICRFNSELFYESRLLPNPENDNQRLEGKTRFAGAGLFYESVEHEGNKNCSEEEVERVKKIVKELMKDTVWVDKKQQKRKLTKDDILVIAPYNAQVHDLSEALPGLRVGTVDKFQGQEAPVVIFSMATSTPEDAPRGMEFLYSLNRMNVAVSRAKAVFVLVASTKLFEPDCKSPGQMKLANAFCRFTEMADMP
jgi:predicted RecB family nuclease